MMYNVLQVASELDVSEPRARALMDFCGYSHERITGACLDVIRKTIELGNLDAVPVEELRDWPEAKASRDKRRRKAASRLAQSGWLADGNTRRAAHDRREAEKRKQEAIKARLSREGLPEK